MKDLARRISILMALVAVIAVGTIACGDDSSEPETFKIGVMNSLTGGGETYGKVSSESKQ